jgi:Protein of unknown function (DUF2911)
MFATALYRSLLIMFLFSTFSTAQAADPPSSTTTCNLEDGRQIYIRYNPVSPNKEKVSNGKAWTPGGTPMTLFTEASLILGSSVIPVGAYSVYPIPAKDHWTIAVNKNVNPGATYDERQDLARAPMETTQVTLPADTLEVAFAHVGPKCTLRIYYGKSASFADFTAK